MSATGTHATASVVPSTSATRGSAPVVDPRPEHQMDAVEVLAPTRGRHPLEVHVVDADQLADLAVDAALLADLAPQRRARRLTVLDAPAGQRPGAAVGPRGEIRVSSTASSPRVMNA